ncbi:hypothetical protein BDZ89DRAFT_1168403 [Hymenopellis radicata]|nr:hypothetical protein BDZ89DRAFT_1168403 [Hymenopellis radicata]
MPSLSIDTEEAPASDGTYPSIQSALINHMLPSTMKWLLDVGFPDAVRSETHHTEDLPDDMFLQLIMLQTPSFQKTSSLYRTWVSNNPTLVRMMKSCKPSPFRELLLVIRGYTLNGVIPLRHADVKKAAMIALQNVMRSDTFGSGTIMTTEDEALIVESVFGGLNWRFHDLGYRDHDFSWLTSELIEKTLRIAFEAQNSAALISHILSYLLCSSTLLPALELVYTGLLERGWLQGLTTNLKHGWWFPDASLPEGAQPLLLWTIHHTGFSVAAFIDGLGVLSSRSSDLYRDLLHNLVEPAHLSTVCKILLLSDVGTQSKLWKLAQFLEIDQWERARDDFISFSVSQQAQAMYRTHLFIPQVGLVGQHTTNVPPSLLRTVADAFASDIARSHYSPPSDTSYGFDKSRYEESGDETDGTVGSVG